MSAKRTSLKILLASSEAVPFAKTGGLGDVAGTLPAALQTAGAQVSVALPRYASISLDFTDRFEPVATLDVPFGEGALPCTIDRLEQEGVTFYFFGNDDLFGRENLYGYDDDCYRFAFFSRAICEAATTLEELRCRVIHCNDWQTALVPVYLQEFYGAVKSRRRMKTMFTVHNAAFQGSGPDGLLAQVGLADLPVAATAATRDDGSVNFMKAALTYTDHVTTVSPTYVQELQTAYFGEGLDPVFRRRAKDFTGILNGIDYNAWNPQTDPFVTNPFSAEDLSGKALCKQQLQEEFGLPVDADRPLVAMVTRLTDQKGVGMVCQEIDRLMERSVQLIVLGTGDPRYEQALADAAQRYPNSMGVALRFDNALSHRMYAGADMLLMPSAFEPCGLSQIIAMRYGTLPVVRETGGLKDSVIPYNQYTGEGTGFSFANLDAYEMGGVLLYACEVFWQNKDAWNQLVQQAMAADFTWSRAADAYLDICCSITSR